VGLVKASLETLSVVANGDKSECPVVYPANSAHWDDVDDNDTDTTYVQSSALTSTQYRDLNFIQNTSISATATINNVTVYIYCRSASATYKAYCRTVIKTHGTEYAPASDQTPSTTYTLYSTTYTTNPNTGNAWTVADLNVLQIGVALTSRRVSSVYYTVRCTWMYCEVFYTVGGQAYTYSLTETGHGSDSSSFSVAKIFVNTASASAFSNIYYAFAKIFLESQTASLSESFSWGKETTEIITEYIYAFQETGKLVVFLIYVKEAGYRLIIVVNASSDSVMGKATLQTIMETAFAQTSILKLIEKLFTNTETSKASDFSLWGKEAIITQIERALQEIAYGMDTFYYSITSSVEGLRFSILLIIFASIMAFAILSGFGVHKKREEKAGFT
jgi:hypothetical protein